MLVPIWNSVVVFFLEAARVLSDHIELVAMGAEG